MFKLFLLLLFCEIGIYVIGQDTADDPMDPIRGPNEDCLRCICHATSGCLDMRNCANYAINRAYWERARRPTVLDDNPNDSASYGACIQDDGCIMRAIRGYLASMVDRDCNCDGKIDCKDYAAIHLKGDQCRSNFDPTQLARLDRCLKFKGQNVIEGWRMECALPGAV